MLARLLVVLVVLAVAWLVGAWWRRRDGRVRVPAEGRLSADQLDAVGLPSDRTDGAAVLLGSPTCGPCTTVRRVLGELADARPSFTWVHVDAADHMELVDQHRVRRVPTLFVVDPAGRILARTSGVPVRRDLEAVLEGGTLAPTA